MDRFYAAFLVAKISNQADILAFWYISDFSCQLALICRLNDRHQICQAVIKVSPLLADLSWLAEATIPSFRPVFQNARGGAVD